MLFRVQHREVLTLHLKNGHSFDSLSGSENGQRLQLKLANCSLAFPVGSDRRRGLCWRFRRGYFHERSGAESRMVIQREAGLITICYC